MKFLTRYLREAKLKRLRRQFQEGVIVSRFVAKDVKRDILVLSASRIEDGILIGRCRTTNVLYLSRGLSEEPPFGETQEIQIAQAWKWTGYSWGGLADGTYLAAHLSEKQKNEN